MEVSEYKDYPLISIHALREEGDCLSSQSISRSHYFYPRPPRGGRPRGPRKESQNPEISIHALREEGDTVCFSPNSSRLNFYPRPPRGGRPRRLESARMCTDFYPRPPRGGRPLQSIHAHTLFDFYPRPPRGGRLQHRSDQAAAERISIHALREEGDGTYKSGTGSPRAFLSTPSARRATYYNSNGLNIILFLSTPSARRATLTFSLNFCKSRISIHALREEGDQIRVFELILVQDFYPRPPRGGRL